jgi:hypothetical protein
MNMKVVTKYHGIVFYFILMHNGAFVLPQMLEDGW